MSYLADGWHVFSFLITPDELKQVLQKHHLVIDNAHVPLDYTESSLSEFIDGYTALYTRLVGGEKLTWENDHRLLMHQGITSDLSGCSFGRFHEFQGEMYKYLDFGEPVVHMSPCTLRFYHDAKQKLCYSSKHSYMQFTEYVMGYQLNYPKRIQYKTETGYEPPRSTQALASYLDYVNLRNAIMKITKTLTVMQNGQVKKTEFRVSNEVKEQLSQCYSFQNFGITIK